MISPLMLLVGIAFVGELLQTGGQPNCNESDVRGETQIFRVTRDGKRDFNFTSKLYKQVSVSPTSGSLGATGYCDVFDETGTKLGRYVSDGLITGVLRAQGSSISIVCDNAGIGSNAFLLKCSGYNTSASTRGIATTNIFHMDSYPRDTSSEWKIEADTFCRYTIRVAHLVLRPCDLLFLQTDDEFGKNGRWQTTNSSFGIHTSGRNVRIQLQAYDENPGRGVLGFAIRSIEKKDCLDKASKINCNETVDITLGDDVLSIVDASPLNFLFLASRKNNDFDSVEPDCRTDGSTSSFRFPISQCFAHLEIVKDYYKMTYIIAKRKRNNGFAKPLKYANITCLLSANRFWTFNRHNPKLGNFFGDLSQAGRLPLTMRIDYAREINDTKFYVDVKLPNTTPAMNFIKIKVTRCWLAVKGAKIIPLGVDHSQLATGHKETKQDNKPYQTYFVLNYTTLTRFVRKTVLKVQCSVLVRNQNTQVVSTSADKNEAITLTSENLSVIPWTSCNKNSPKCTLLCTTISTVRSCVCAGNKPSDDRTNCPETEAATETSTGKYQASSAALIWVPAIVASLVIVLLAVAIVLGLKKTERCCFKGEEALVKEKYWTTHLTV